MSSPADTGPTVATSDRNRMAKRKKKSKKAQSATQSKAEQLQVQWRSETQQRVYSSKLLHALAHGQLCGAGPSGGGGVAVREAADRALAVAAKGRTRWSRAILTSRLKMKFRKQRKPTEAAWSCRRKPSMSLMRLKGKAVPAVQKKVRHLGRLVPGCRKEPLPVILEEVTDYIAALEMQVRAMSTLAQLLSIGSNPAAPPAPYPRPPTL